MHTQRCRFVNFFFGFIMSPVVICGGGDTVLEVEGKFQTKIATAKGKSEIETQMLNDEISENKSERMNLR